MNFHAPHVVTIQGKQPGKTLLITAGMDGDEYAGMEAAERLIQVFKSGDFSGRLVVVPIMNMEGFRAECSQNPLDGKFPKNIFPGNANGSPTEQLVHWLVSTYAAKADAWHDMHGGSITEGLHPFFWTYRTGVSEIDAMTLALHETVDAETILYEGRGLFSKAVRLAKDGCLCTLAESGSLGRREQGDIERHIAWAKSLMAVLGMIDIVSSQSITPAVLTHVAYTMAPAEGIWRPNRIERTVKRGDVIGTSMHANGSHAREIIAQTSGTVLWWKETMAMRKGDILLATGTL